MPTVIGRSSDRSGHFRGLLILVPGSSPGWGAILVQKRALIQGPLPFSITKLA